MQGVPDAQKVAAATESPEAGVGGTTGGENGGTTNPPTPPTEDNEEDWSTDDDFGFDEDLRKN